MNYLTNSFLLLILLCGFGAATTFAQEPGIDDTEAEQIIEDLVAESDEEFDFDTYLEQLEFYKQNPLDLNEAGKDDLQGLRLLNDLQIAALLNYREQFGNLIAIYELQAVPHFDLQTIYKILPFVAVRGDLTDVHIPFSELLYKGKRQLFIRYQQVLEEQKGYTIPESSGQTRYLGSPIKLYTRFRYNYGTHISYGFTAEKDAGEQFLNGTQPHGFDFYSAHFYLRNQRRIKYLALGDYEVKLGQGLVMWSGLGFRKSPYVMNIKKQGRTLRPYTSVNENRFLRGAGITVEAGGFDVTVFGSHKGVDANILEPDTSELVNEELVQFSSFQESGYHRTSAEIADKNSIKRTVAGANISYEKRNYKIGATGLHTRMDAPLAKNIKPYNQFEFAAQNLTNFSIDYSYIWQNINLFGETAVSDNGGWATLNGALISLDPKVDLSLLYRHFQRDYQALFGNAFAEGTKPANETGLYLGMSVRPVRKWALDAYYDIYEHPWLRYQIDAPSHGREYFAQLTYRPSRKLEIYGRIKNEIKKKNAPGSDAVIDYLADIEKTAARIHTTYRISESVSMRSRVDLSFFKDQADERESGYLIYQDIIYKSIHFPLSFATRFSLFDTDSYDTRIYAYENDVLYAFSIPAFQNKGTRFYLTARYNIIRNVDIWLRFAQTYYAGEKTIGAGLEEIEGNTRSEIKAQLRFKF